ncbi:MAG: Stp1/IreP family PP2C-type Ser/Thr phosphatase [Sporolactobacillus sp.]
MKAVFGSDVGRQRSHNEDSVNIFYHGSELLAVVADGMGGHAAGEVASTMAVQYAEKKWQEREAEFTQDEAVGWINHLVRGINVHLYDYAESHETCRGMGTTFAAAFCSKNFIVITTVGDSRIYSWNEGEAVQQVTEDHTLVNELLKSGQISKIDAERHPEKHVLMRALGTEPAIELDTLTLNWSQCSHLILCSDGLTNKLSDEGISGILGSAGSLQEKIEQMISAANDAGGEDNISLIIISRDSDGEQI